MFCYWWNIIKIDIKSRIGYTVENTVLLQIVYASPLPNVLCYCYSMLLLSWVLGRKLDSSQLCTSRDESTSMLRGFFDRHWDFQQVWLFYWWEVCLVYLKSSTVSKISIHNDNIIHSTLIDSPCGLLTDSEFNRASHHQLIHFNSPHPPSPPISSLDSALPKKIGVTSPV